MDRQVIPLRYNIYCPLLSRVLICALPFSYRKLPLLRSTNLRLDEFPLSGLISRAHPVPPAVAEAAALAYSDGR